MSEDSDYSSLGSCTKGGEGRNKRKHSFSDESSEFKENCTIEKVTTSKKQSTLLSFVVNKNDCSDESLHNNDDNSESSSKSLDYHETAFDDNDVTNRSNTICLRKKWIAQLFWIKIILILLDYCN